MDIAITFGHASHSERNLQAPRRPSVWERAAIKRIASVQFPGVEEIRRQADLVRVIAECDRCPTVALEIHAAQRPLLQPHHRPAGPWDTDTLPVELSGVDRDGVEIEILLHRVGGFLAELEVYRVDGGAFLGLPNVESMSIISAGEGSAVD